MGWDIVPIGIRHSINTESYKTVASDLSRMFDAEITVFYWDFYYENRTIICKIGNSSTNKSYWLDVSTNEKDCKLPFELILGDDYESDQITIHQEFIDFYLYNCYGRWFELIHLFTIDDMIYDKFLAYRKELMRISNILGCESVIFCSDQGDGSRIWYEMQKDSSTPQSLFSYIEEKKFLDSCDVERKENSISIDIPTFFKENMNLIDNKDKYVDVLYDDFGDLKSKNEG